jgi:large subunit ribosomal protein L6
MTTAGVPQLPGTQSRVGKRPLPIPAGVEVQVSGRKISIKGPKGSMSRELPEQVALEVKDKTVFVRPNPKAGLQGKQYQGLARALIGSMLEGAAKGFAVSLDLIGVGYRCEVKGQTLNLALGLSHPVQYKLPDSVAARVEIIDEAGIKKPRLHLTSYDKMVLGQTAARIRSFRPPEPYKGKGVRYTGEKIREKAGKAGGGKSAK